MSRDFAEKSGWPYLIEPDAVAQTYNAVSRMVEIARAVTIRPHLIPYCSPFTPLCFFLALRYIIVVRDFPGGREDLSDVPTLKQALLQLKNTFPVAGNPISVEAKVRTLSGVNQQD
jgi:hypothetical protein